MKPYEKPQMIAVQLSMEEMLALSVIEGGKADPEKGVMSPRRKSFETNWE